MTSEFLCRTVSIFCDCAVFFHFGVHGGCLFCSSDIFYQYGKPMKAGTHAYKQSMDCWILTHGDMSYGRIFKADQPLFLETLCCWRIGWQRRLGRALLKSMGSGQIDSVYPSSTMLCDLENSISTCISLPIKWETIMVPFSLGVVGIYVNEST